LGIAVFAIFCIPNIHSGHLAIMTVFNRGQNQDDEALLDEPVENEEDLKEEEILDESPTSATNEVLLKKALKSTKMTMK
jgi:hypothetical protein